MYSKFSKYKDKIRRDIPSDFLEKTELLSLKSILNKEGIKYNEFKPFEEAEKTIIYNETLPAITVFKITSHNKITHKDILGSLFSHGLEPSVWGDILITGDESYLIILKRMEEYFENFFLTVGKRRVSLEKVLLDEIKNYKYDFEIVNIITSSERLDCVLASICNTSRSIIHEKLKKDEIRVNYEIVNKHTYLVKMGDILSIRKVGKFKYEGVVKSTKKGNSILEFKQYK